MKEDNYFMQLEKKEAIEERLQQLKELNVRVIQCKEVSVVKLKHQSIFFYSVIMLPKVPGSFATRRTTPFLVRGPSKGVLFAMGVVIDCTLIILVIRPKIASKWVWFINKRFLLLATFRCGENRFSQTSLYRVRNEKGLNFNLVVFF